MGWPQILSAVLALTLCGIAALHLYWGLGGFWPGSDESSLVSMVVGRTPGMAMPGLIACSVVAACLFAAALLAIGGGRFVPLPNTLGVLVRIGLAGAALVFLARGAAGYVPAFTNYALGTPFAALNAWYYSPLCLVIGAGLATLALQKPAA